MGSTFIRNGRQDHVEALFSAYRLMSGEARHGPQLISLEASPGQGKTRVVQEFYGWIAAEQEFWPKALVPAKEDGRLRDTRKFFSLPRTWQTGGGEVPFLWLGIECSRDSRGAETADLIEPMRFLNQTLPSVFGNPKWTFDDWLSEFRSQGADVAIATAMDTVGLTFSAFVPAGGVVRLGAAKLHDMVKHRRSERLEKTSRLIELDLGLDEELALALASASKHKPSLPIVLVIEDSQFAPEVLCASLLQLLRPDNTRRPNVLVVATGWSELLDDDGNTFGSLMEELNSAGCQVQRRTLTPFSATEASLIVKDRYPETDDQLAVALAAHVDGNPHGVSLLLQLRDVLAFTSADAIELPLDEVSGLPSELSSLYGQLWSELDEAVREVLAIAALQKEKPVASLTQFMAARLLGEKPDSDGVYAAMIDRAIDPYRWIRRFEGSDDLLRFYETERFRLAEAYNIRPHRQQAPGLIEDFVLAARKDEVKWANLPSETRVRLLELHTSAAKADPDLDQHQGALSLAQLANEHPQAVGRLELLLEAIDWAREAEKSAPETAPRIPFNVVDEMSVPLSLWIVKQLPPAASFGGTRLYDVDFEEFRHLLDMQADAGAVSLVVTRARERFASVPELGGQLKDWVDASRGDPDESAWRRMVFFMASVGSAEESASYLRESIGDGRVTPTVKSRSRRMLGRLVRDTTGDTEAAVEIVLGDLDEPDLPSRERSWARQFAAQWLESDGSFERALELLEENVRDPRIEPKERGLTRRKIAYILRDDLAETEAACRYLRTWIADPSVSAEHRSLGRRDLAEFLSGTDPSAAIAVLEEDLRDPHTPRESSARSQIALGRLLGGVDRRRALSILDGVGADAERLDPTQRANYESRAKHAKYFVLLTEPPAEPAIRRSLLEELIAEPECPLDVLGWARRTLATEIHTERPNLAVELLAAEISNPTQMPRERELARELLVSLGLAAAEPTGDP